MANQTVTTAVNYDSAAISGLLDGETITINGGSVTIDADVRWNQQAAVFGAVTLSATLGGALIVDGTKIWEVPFSASTGNVPAQAALGSNGVSGGTSGATGELTRVWATGSLTPATAGTAMPASGYIKLRSRTGTFQAGETITLPGGATVTASGAGRRSWISVVGREGQFLTLPRLGNATFIGDWYELGTTNGTDDQTFQFPVADECPAVQVETAAGSGSYEWWLNAGRRWIGHAQLGSQTASGVTAAPNSTARPPTTDVNGFLSTGTLLRETATTAVHQVSTTVNSNAADAGVYTIRTYVRKDTRRWCYVGAFVNNQADRYGVIIDFDAGGAVVATPTLGSPANTSNTVTAVGGGWFLVQVTISHSGTAATQMGGIVATSNSVTPTLSGGVPSFAGSTSEGVIYSELQVVAPSSLQFVESADDRGKFFFSNQQTGVLTFSQRIGRTAGLRPASGCRVRVPNVILSSANAIDYTANIVNPATNNRYTFSTGAGGAINLDTVTSNWFCAATSPYSANFQRVATYAINIFNPASTVTVADCGIGVSRDVNAFPSTSGPLRVTGCQSGGAITDTRVAASVVFVSTVLDLATCSGFAISRCRFEAFGLQGSTLRAPNTVSIASSSNCTFTDCAFVGAGLSMSACSGITFTGSTYANKTAGVTVAGDLGVAFALSGSSGVLIDGLAAFAGIANVHPYNSILTTGSNTNGVEMRNIGTPASPYNGGTANQMGRIAAIGANSYNTTLRRVYTQNLRQGPLSTSNTSQVARFINVWGDGANPQDIAALDVISRGCRWSNSQTAASAVYGVHIEDAFTGLTSGRITIYGNEPLQTTADQCSGTFGTNAGFTSNGGIAMPNVGDTVTWTMPYYAMGHTGIAQFSYGASTTETWTTTGTNQQNLEYEYQIDTGSGAFSAWRFLLDIARRSTGGTSGTNTITLTDTDVAAMTRKPAVGDRIQTASARLPGNATITGVSGASGNVLTLSGNFASNASTNELVYIWRDIAEETISPTAGYRLRVRARANAANASNLFSGLRIPFDTTALAQQTQYPLPGSIVNISGLVPQSRVKLSRIDTGALLAQTSSGAGTTVQFDVPYSGAVAIEARNASTSPSYRPWITQTTISSSAPTNVVALQETD